MMPPEVAEIRRELCKCKGVNHNDPCAACPEGHFGRYTAIGCEDASPAPAVTTRPSLQQRSRPGDLLAAIIFRVTGITHIGSCACETKQRQMNKWGWWGCWRNRKMIVRWLCEEAMKRGYPLEDSDALGLLKVAIRELRK